MSANIVDQLFEKIMNGAEAIITEHGAKEGFSTGAQVGAILAVMSFVEDARISKNVEIMAFAQKAGLTVIADIKGE